MDVGERLTLVFTWDTVNAEGALLRIQSRLSALGTPSRGFKLDGKPISIRRGTNPSRAFR